MDCWEGGTPQLAGLELCPFCAAIDLINNLLQVKMRKRYSVDKSLSHPWLQVLLGGGLTRWLGWRGRSKSLIGGQVGIEVGKFSLGAGD